MVFRDSWNKEERGSACDTEEQERRERAELERIWNAQRDARRGYRTGRRARMGLLGGILLWVIYAAGLITGSLWLIHRLP